MRDLPVIGIGEVHLDEASVVEIVREALIDFAGERIVAPLPGLLASEQPPGDCHIKFAQSARHGLIVVKVATGFYDNAAHGLPVNDGLLNVFSAVTGKALCVVDDAGRLTGLRTAAAGVLAARLGGENPTRVVGIVGTGHQAHLQAAWAARHLTAHPIQVHGRNPAKARALAGALAAEGIDHRLHADVESLAASADTIMLCTNAWSPVLEARHIRAGHHIVSLGADGPGKAELSVDAYGRANAIAVDDRAQALRRSDFAAAAGRGAITATSLNDMGDLLAQARSLRARDTDVTIVNLCGSAACDLALVAHLIGDRPDVERRAARGDSMRARADGQRGSGHPHGEEGVG